MKRSILAVFALSASVLANTAFAACSCSCVGNQRQWICSNSWDVPAGYCGGYCSSVDEESMPKGPEQAAADGDTDLNSILHKAREKTTKPPFLRT